jgi:ATP-dependent Clp protease ATP-binding subunit ClpC
MFERFTPRSRRAIVMAQEEARLLSHNYIGTEHLLLGLLADGDGDAAHALESLDVTLEAARDQVRQMIGEGHESQSGHIPFTARAKKVLELSLREALTLRSQSIGSVHLLLGLVAEGEGVGAQILERLGAPLATVRERAIEMAEGGAERDPAPVEEPAMAWAARGGRVVRVEGWRTLLDTINSIDRRLSRIERHLGIASEPAAAAEPGETAAEPGETAAEPGETAAEPGETAAEAE